MYKRSKYETENILSIFQTYYRYIYPVSLIIYIYVYIYEDGIESHNDIEQATEQ